MPIENNIAELPGLNEAIRLLDITANAIKALAEIDILVEYKIDVSQFWDNMG